MLHGSSCAEDSPTEAVVDVSSDVWSDLAPETVEDVALACSELGNGAPCDDGNACTQGDECDGTVCAGTTTVVCDEFDICRPGSCDALVGCVYETLPDETVCYVACFDEARCLGGKCTVVPESELKCPAPTNPCLSQWGCDPLTGGCTKAIIKPDGVACERDEDVCTSDVCEAGECVATGAVEGCDELAQSNPCWSHVCDPELGCVAIEFKLGDPCDDSAACTVDDVCTHNEFMQELCLGAPISVDDGNACTNDKCVAGVVSHKPVIGASCVLDHACAPSGLCSAEGVCVPNDTCPCQVLEDCPTGALDCADGSCLY